MLSKNNIHQLFGVKGSEPSRNSFDTAFIVLRDDPDLVLTEIDVSYTDKPSHAFMYRDNSYEFRKYHGIRISDTLFENMIYSINNIFLRDFDKYVSNTYPEVIESIKKVNELRDEYTRSAMKGMEQDKTKTKNKKRNKRAAKRPTKEYNYELVYQDAPSYDPEVEKETTEFRQENDVAAVIYAYDLSHICSVEDSLEYALDKGKLSEDEYDDLYDDSESAISVLSELLTMDEVLDLDPYIDDEGNIIELKNTSTGKVLIKGEFIGPNGEDEDEYYDNDWD